MICLSFPSKNNKWRYSVGVLALCHLFYFNVVVFSFFHSSYFLRGLLLAGVLK